MDRKYCKMCRTDSCTRGMFLKVPGNHLRRMWVCKSCLIKSDHPVVTFNAKIGTYSKQAILEGRLLLCPYLCARKAPRSCGAPQSHLWAAVQDFAQTEAEVIRAIESHGGAHSRGEAAGFVDGEGEKNH